MILHRSGESLSGEFRLSRTWHVTFSRASVQHEVTTPRLAKTRHFIRTGDPLRRYSASLVGSGLGADNRWRR